MLKRISTSDVELGMFVHKLEGSWFKHPFWKTKFLLEDPAMLADLHASDVAGVIIDTSRGLDLRPKPVRPVMAETAPVPSAPIVRPERRRPLVSRSNEAPPIDLRSIGDQSDPRPSQGQARCRPRGRSRFIAGLPQVDAGSIRSTSRQPAGESNSSPLACAQTRILNRLARATLSARVREMS